MAETKKIIIVGLIGKDAVTRQLGSIVFNAMCLEIKLGNNILLDFSGLRGVVGGFCRESIGKLYATYQKEILDKSVSFENLSQRPVWVECVENAIKEGIQYFNLWQK